MTVGGKASARKTFPRRARLLKPSDFKYVFDHPVVSSDRFFRVFARSGRTPSCRLGIAVSRKVDRRAVGRNRIKRIVRESFRHEVHAANPAPGGANEGCGRDYIVVASLPSAKAADTELRASLSRHWRSVDSKLDQRSAQPTGR